MKQIIVNVGGLSVGEKHRVNKALAKITGFKKSSSNLVTANWMYAPSLYTDNVITHSSGNRSNENKEPTHTPQQVLEMAEMETSTDQHMLIADEVAITDSSGRIIYDGTSESISTFIKSHAEYRRKPKTHTVNGTEISDLRFEPKAGDNYYLVNPTEPELFNYEIATGNKYDSVWAERGLCYEDTEAGKQAAISHAKAWLGIA